MSPDIGCVDFIELNVQVGQSSIATRTESLFQDANFASYFKESRSIICGMLCLFDSNTVAPSVRGYGRSAQLCPIAEQCPASTIARRWLSPNEFPR